MAVQNWMVNLVLVSLDRRDKRAFDSCVFEVIVHLEEASSLETRDNKAVWKNSCTTWLRFYLAYSCPHFAFLHRVSAIDTIFVKVVEKLAFSSFGNRAEIPVNLYLYSQCSRWLNRMGDCPWDDSTNCVRCFWKDMRPRLTLKTVVSMFLTFKLGAPTEAGYWGLQYS